MVGRGVDSSLEMIADTTDRGMTCVSLIYLLSEWSVRREQNWWSFPCDATD